MNVRPREKRTIMMYLIGVLLAGVFVVQCRTADNQKEEGHTKRLEPKQPKSTAYMYLDEGYHSRDLNLYESALKAIKERQFDEGRSQLVRAADQEKKELADIYRVRGLLEQFAGRYYTATDWYEEALKLNRKDPYIPVLKNVSLFYTGDYAEPPKSLSAKTVDYEESSSDPLLARQLDDMALSLSDNRENREAELFYMLAFDIRKRVLGEEHPDVVISFNNLGEIAYYQGRSKEAKEWYYQAILLLEKTVGPDHPDVANMLNNIAVIYYDQRLCPEAEVLFRRALSIKEKTLGRDDREVVEAMVNLAETYRCQQEYALAESLFTSALAIQEKALWSDSVGLAEILYYLAETNRDQRKYSEAEPMLLRAIETLEAYDPLHPDLRNYLSACSRMLFETGRLKESESINQRMIEALERRE